MPAVYAIDDVDLRLEPLPAKVSKCLGPERVTDDGLRGDHCPLDVGPVPGW